MTADETATVTVDVTNVGSRAGSEVVQLYITDVASLCTRPLKELKGFRKIGLAPGETRTVRFEVGREQLQYIGRDYRPTVEPGLFRITVGRHAEDDGLTADLVVEEAARTQP
jgi:beta-glucosidase